MNSTNNPLFLCVHFCVCTNECANRRKLNTLRVNNIKNPQVICLIFVLEQTDERVQSKAIDNTSEEQQTQPAQILIQRPYMWNVIVHTSPHSCQQLGQLKDNSSKKTPISAFWWISKQRINWSITDKAKFWVCYIKTLCIGQPGYQLK